MQHGAEPLGLVRYDSMCRAIAACHRVDEAKEIRDKAKALQVYAQQAHNREAERKAAQVRIPAERRAGQLLIEMKEKGERQGATRPKKASGSATLSSFGISRDQSSQWQQLAEIPEEAFERALLDTPVFAASTSEILSERELRELDKVIDEREQKAIRGRWECGKILLTLRAGNKELPRDVLKQLLDETGKSRAELKLRMQFAERYPDEDAVNRALAEHRYWHNIAFSLKEDARMDQRRPTNDSPC